MVFAHDTEVTLATAVALVNSRTGGQAGDRDGLTDVAALDRFVSRWGISGGRAGTTTELDAVRRLRDRLADLWHVDEDEAVSLVNALLRDCRALPQLIRHDGWGYHVHATAADAPLADRLAVEVAMAMTDVIRMKELDRLRRCDGPDCASVFVDLSRNRSRRYCDGGCGNRANVAAWRARRAGS